MKKIIALTVFSILFFGCGNSSKENKSSYEKMMNAKKHPGKAMMENNCYVCHSHKVDEDSRIGPPMIAIKETYLKVSDSKEEFIKVMKDWIENPTAEKALMLDEVERFGVMPKQHFPEETIEQIADYLYDFDIEKPDWYKSSSDVKQEETKQTQEHQTNFEKLPYAERGLKYALTTKAVLGKNLMGTIQKKGTIEALAFCNERAYPLTDSMAKVHNANIKRVSDKPRNQNNQANSKELEYINQFKTTVANGEEPTPIVDETEESVYVYYPIVTNSMCLQCHGTPNQTIEPATFEKIKTLYPKDKAIGYSANEVRGIWSINFKK